MAEWVWIIKLILATIVAVIAAVCDCKTRKIPNWLTFSAVSIGVIATFLQGWREGLSLLVVLSILFFFGMLRLLGMGDLKLLMALAALTMPVWTPLIILMACGWFVAWEFASNPQGCFKRIQLLWLSVTMGCGIPADPKKAKPMAPCILLGFLTVLIGKGAVL